MEAVLSYGTVSYDEKRERLALQNVRIKSEKQEVPDDIILRFANKENVQAIIDLHFNNSKMYDFDVVPSFPAGAKSYYQRVKDGKMIDFVIKRLTTFPESKKAVISFINYNDYKAVLANPKDDYLPCLVSCQFRLLPNNYEVMNSIANFRSIDVFQKAAGNFSALTLLGDKIAEELSKSLHRCIKLGSLDMMITDAHIYSETLKEARKVLKKYDKNNKN